MFKSTWSPSWGGEDEGVVVLGLVNASTITAKIGKPAIHCKHTLLYTGALLRHQSCGLERKATRNCYCL
jgi:hypothetical protein